MSSFKKCDPLSITVLIVLIGLLGLIRLNEGYLLFHVIVELFAVIVGIIIAVIAYYMHTFIRNNFLLFLGIGFFWVSFLDFFHMLSYHGMNLYSDDLTPNIATTLWIFGRILWIITILSAPFVIFKRVSSRFIFIFIGAVSIALYLASLKGFMPLMYSSEGLTPIKIRLEYIVIIFSLLAMWIYYTKQNTFNPTMYRMIQFSLIFGIAAESCFTLYTDVYGIMNFSGHIFKFLSYWMIFQGIVVAALKEPFSVMAKASNTYDTIPVSVVIADSEGIIRQINQATTRCFSKTSKDIVGYDNHDLLHPYGIDKSECGICQAIGQNKQTSVEVAFGKQYKQYTVSPIEVDGQVTGALQICTDMTELRKTQQQLNESEEFYRTIFSSVNEAILILHDNVIMDCNELALELFEKERVELIGMDIFDSADNIECRDKSMDFHLDSAYLGRDTIAECSLTLHTKETKVVEFSLSGLGAGTENKLVMIARDITKKIESEKLFNLQTRQAQMGEMISMIAHQWRQPLAIINAITTQMRFKDYMSGNEDSIEQNNLIKIEEQCTHLSQTISEYRDFFRPDKPKEYFELSLLLRHALNLIEHTLKNQGIEIEEVIGNTPKLFSYRNEILQVLIALLKNSLDAFEENGLEYGKITITIQSNDSYCILSIHDNAGGISPENMNKLFIPYFTTKNKIDGTGLGLYMSKMIIQDHCHGILEVHSQNSETIFTVKIPHTKEGNNG